MTNKEWLATLSEEEFYDKIKQIEHDEARGTTNSREYMIEWLGNDHIPMSITEDMHVHEEWFDQAENVYTVEDLTAFVNHVMFDYSHDYGTACHAITACALAAAWLGSHAEHITGFQASLIMWGFIFKWWKKNNKCGLKMIDYDDMLFPQYSYKFEKTISSGYWDAIQKEAENLLSKNNDHASPDVVKHWESIVSGEVPFGYIVKDE